MGPVPGRWWPPRACSPPAGDVDRHGLHVMNIEGMRRAVAQLDPGPAYVLTDGFPVRGLTVPALAVPKGDATVACIAAASVLAKVTRDRIMVDMHSHWPEYEFATHKGYVTPAHAAALTRHGPCPEHRFSYVNVARVAAGLPDEQENGRDPEAAELPGLTVGGRR